MSSERDKKHGGGRITFVTGVQPNDVLMGRGAHIMENSGNRRYLYLIHKNCSDYQQAATRKAKDAIARQIFSTIHARNGLFLQKLDSPQEARVLAWTAVDGKTVLLKIKQALRDRGLGIRDQARTPPQDHANASELLYSDFDAEEFGADEMVAHDTSDFDAEEFGADEMVAHDGLSSHEIGQPPPAKRAKTQSFQNQTPNHVVSTQVPAPTGHEAFESMPKPYFPNVSQGFHFGTLISQPSFTPHLPHEQNWNANAAAGLNIPPATHPIIQFDEGKLRADFRPAFANHHQAASANIQVKGGELKTDKELSGSTEGPNNETTGEIALRIACSVCEMGQTPVGGGVKLDPIELCLLSVLISRGLPTLSSTQFQKGDNCRASNSTPCPLTWSDVGNHLVQEVQSFSSGNTSKPFINGTPNQRGSPVLAGSVSRLVSMASAYSKNPTSLAHMAVMLLEKLRMHSESIPTTKPNAVGMIASVASRTCPGLDSSDSSGRAASWMSHIEHSREGTTSRRGSNDPPRGVAMYCLPTPDEFLFQTYITTELRLWAASLNVTDEVGFPVIPYNSNDVVADFLPCRHTYIFSTAAVLDAIGCQAVLCQVTFLTRLRSLFQNCSSNQILSVIRTTDEMPLLGISLLQALLVNGFSRLLDSTETDDLLGILLRHKSITKADVERRLIQFTCLLHKHVQSPKTTQTSNQPNSWK